MDLANDILIPISVIWQHHNPKPSKGKTRVTQDINVMARYIDNSDGTIVNGHQVTDMRAVANQVFHQLLKCNATAPKFKLISRDVINFFLQEMYLFGGPVLCMA